MLLSNLEYIPLRLLRRYALRDTFLLRFGELVPYYRANRNQVDPASLADDYARSLSKVEFARENLRILEIGVGRTNSTCYEMEARLLPKAVFALEPFVSFGREEDARLLRMIATRHGRQPEQIAGRVRRVLSMDEIADQSIDLVLSSSVLEHVGDPVSLFGGLRRVMAPDGGMLHLVDYRDHFFKYPFHFLQFRKRTWSRWLDPGDLPVWRLYDHVEQLGAAGFAVRVLEETQDPAAYELIAPYISGDYRKGDVRLRATAAVLWATSPHPK